MLKSLWQDIRQANTGWIMIWGLIYVGFLAGDLFAPGFIGDTALKLLGLFVCFVYAWHKSPDDHLLIIALGFTLLADVILALNNVNPWGVFVFCIVHFFHMARLTDVDPVKHHLLPTYLGLAGLVFLGGMLLKIEPVVVLGAIYAVTLLSNLLLAGQWHKREPKSAAARHAFVGFLLFAACDLCVALSYLSSVNFLPGFFALAGVLVWPFYYPSQIFICSSSKSVIK